MNGKLIVFEGTDGSGKATQTALLCKALEQAGTPVSASAVRRLLAAGDKEALQALLPATTYAYLQEKNLLK